MIHIHAASLEADGAPQDVLAAIERNGTAGDYSFLLDDSDRAEIEDAQDNRRGWRGFHIEDAPDDAP